jgi:hypothetical protein
MAITIKEASNTPLAIAALAKGMADTYVNYSGQRMQDKQYQQGLDRQNRLDIQGQDNWQSTFDATEKARYEANEANRNAILLAAKNREEDHAYRDERNTVLDARAGRADDRADTSLGLQQDQFGLQQDQFAQSKKHQDRTHEKSVTDTAQGQSNWEKTYDLQEKEYLQSLIKSETSAEEAIRLLTDYYQKRDGSTPEEAEQNAVSQYYNTTTVMQNPMGIGGVMVDKGSNSQEATVDGRGNITPTTALGQAAAESGPLGQGSAASGPTMENTPGSSQNNPIYPKNKAEFDAIPSGTWIHDGSGLRQKG